MAKNIIIGILLVFTLSSLAYALTQQSAAVKAQHEAEESMARAMDAEKMAALNMKEAMRQRQITAEELRKCAQSK